MYLDIYKKTGAEFILATGRFIGPKTVEATLPDGSVRRLRGTNVIISTGTRAAIDPIPGLAEAQPLTHIEALELGEVPEHLVVIGGGYIGLELAQAMRRFGSKVSLVERNDRLVNREDEDVSEGLLELFRDEGIEVFLHAEIKRISGKSGERVKIVIDAKWSGENARGKSRAGGDGAEAEHGGNRAGVGRRGTDRSWIHQGE